MNSLMGEEEEEANSHDTDDTLCRSHLWWEWLPRESQVLMAAIDQVTQTPE